MESEHIFKLEIFEWELSTQTRHKSLIVSFVMAEIEPHQKLTIEKNCWDGINENDNITVDNFLYYSYLPLVNDWYLDRLQGESLI